MTSFIIKSHLERVASGQWKSSDCAFCAIIQDDSPAFRVYENERVLAILDIMPLRHGHILVIPKAHYTRVSDLPPEIAAALGETVSKVAHALTQALNNTGLNVVCNQEYAQAVPHVHYHIIPAPILDKPTPMIEKPATAIPTMRQMHRMEFESRQELEDDQAELLVKQIRAKL
ncbi:HIT-like protein [Mycena floridula]|nr:HIT-like protein [Mycena floridula]